MKIDKDNIPENFCIYPWVHTSVQPDGRVLPCCVYDYENPLAFMGEQSLSEIWNGEKMKKMRLDFLAGKKDPGCKVCHTREGFGFSESPKDAANDRFKYLFDTVEKTREDGSLPGTEIRYLDFRFSNICNLRCRTCGPQLSSAWYQDNATIYGKEHTPSEVYRPMKSKEEILEEFEKFLPHLEEIYFCGGEPLFMDEHYLILERLIELGKTDIRLTYNSNFSILNYKNWDAIELWKNFTNLKVWASIDGLDERFEYIRKGASWDQTLGNLRRFKNEIPNSELRISYTLSIFNAFHTPDFVKFILAEKLVKEIDQIEINILLKSDHYRIQVLPEKFKDQLKSNFEYLINELSESGKLTESFKDKISEVIRFAYEVDGTKLLAEFERYVRVMDALREENFEKTFPEIKGVFESLKNRLPVSLPLSPPATL